MIAASIDYRVPYADTDQMTFVYYANYLIYFEMAREELMRAIGLPYSRLEELCKVVSTHLLNLHLKDCACPVRVKAFALF